MDKKELKNITKEFINTVHGKAFWYYSNILCLITIILAVSSIILIKIEDGINLKVAICVISFFISFCTYCLAQLFYHKMLLDYIKEKKLG